jgi:hypothetical protein
METIKLSIAIQSHLSDAMIEMDFNQDLAEKRIRLVKILLHRYPQTNIDIEVSELNKIYREEVLGLVSVEA